MSSVRGSGSKHIRNLQHVCSLDHRVLPLGQSFASFDAVRDPFWSHDMHDGLRLARQQLLCLRAVELLGRQDMGGARCRVPALKSAIGSCAARQDHVHNLPPCECNNPLHFDICCVLQITVDVDSDIAQDLGSVNGLLRQLVGKLLSSGIPVRFPGTATLSALVSCGRRTNVVCRATFMFRERPLNLQLPRTVMNTPER